MAYSKNLFERLKDLNAPPKDRRKGKRRLQPRRQKSSQPLLISNLDRRASNDRRDNDRRAIKLSTTCKASTTHAHSYLFDPQNWKNIFPNIEIKRIKPVSSHQKVVDIEARIPEGVFSLQIEITSDPSQRLISLTQTKGDLISLYARIEISPEESGSKITTSTLLEVGLGSLEAIFGEIFKRRLTDIIRRMLENIQRALGGSAKNVSTYGFLVHTIPDYFAATFGDKTFANIPDALFQNILKELPPFKCSKVVGTTSITGQKTDGFLIYSPFAAEHFLSIDKNRLLEHMVDAAHIAKDLGAQIIGLGAYTAFVGRRGVDIAEKTNMPITTGTSYTIASAVMALEKAAEDAGLNQESVYCVIGATGSIGKVCAEMIALKAKHLLLVSRNETRLKSVADHIKAKNPGCAVTYTTSINEAFKKCDAFLISTNSPESFNISEIRPGAIICDISQPRNISYHDAMNRKDIAVIDGGVINPPGNTNFNFHFGLPNGLAYACMAETMILALEGKFESFSIGGNISIEKVSEIKHLGDKHGFELASLKSFGKLIPMEKFKFLQEVRK